jgi:hypothetical protein
MKVLNSPKAKLSVHESPTKSSSVVIDTSRKNRANQVKEYKCNCGKAYYSRSSLYIHINKKHKGITPSLPKKSLVAVKSLPSEISSDVQV